MEPTERARCGNDVCEWDRVATRIGRLTRRQGSIHKQVNSQQCGATTYGESRHPLLRPSTLVPVRSQWPRQNITHDKTTNQTSQMGCIVDALNSRTVQQVISDKN